METPVFVLDANVFIEAKNRYYAFDLAPGFWANLINHATNGRIKSIDRVKDELERGKDALASWAKKDFSEWFDSTKNSEDIIQCYGKIMTWVQSMDQFSDAAKSDFARAADGWLVAYAKVNGCIIVTHEVLAPYAQNKVKIPNICSEFKVSYCDTFEMLRKLGVRFS